MAHVCMLLIGIVLVTHLNTCFSERVKADQKSHETIEITWTYQDPHIQIQIYPIIINSKPGPIVLDPYTTNYNYAVTQTFSNHTFEVRAVFENNDTDEIGTAFLVTWPAKPSPPKIDLAQTKPGINKIDVFWKVPTDVEGTIKSYDVRATINGAVVKTCIPDPPTVTTCTLEGLDQLTSHKISVRVEIAKGDYGYPGDYSEYSEEVQFSTTAEKPPPPTDLNLSTPELGKIVAQWKPPDPFPQSASFSRSFKNKTNTEGFRMKTIERQETDNEATYRNLEHYKDYEFSVKLCIVDVCSDALIDSKKTLPAPPEPPTILEAYHVGNNQVIVNWKEPTNPNGPLDQVIITAWIGDVEKENCTLPKSKEHICKFENLDFFTEYSFTATAYNKPKQGYDFSGGYSKKSDAFKFKTHPGQPGVPEDVAPTVDGGVITVTWKAPKVLNGDIELYEGIAEIGEEVIEKCETKPEELSCSFDQNLKYGTVYNVSVRAKTKPNNQNLGGGYGSYSTPVEVTTDESASVNVGLIVGLVVGAIVLIALIALIIVLVKRRNTTPDDDSTSKDSGDDVVQL